MYIGVTPFVYAKCVCKLASFQGRLPLRFLDRICDLWTGVKSIRDLWTRRFKGHVCSKEHGAGDGLGSRLCASMCLCVCVCMCLWESDECVSLYVSISVCVQLYNLEKACQVAFIFCESEFLCNSHHRTFVCTGQYIVITTQWIVLWVTSVGWVRACMEYRHYLYATVKLTKMGCA